MYQRSPSLAVLPLAALLFASPAFAEDTDEVEIVLTPQQTIRLERFDESAAAIEIDGKLEESVWTRVAVHSDLKVLEPDTLADPPHRTDIRLFYTDRGLYVAFDMEQPLDTLLRRYTSRDDFRVKRDRVSFTLDTSGGGRYGYFMGLALGDSQNDGTILPERQYKSDWDGAWYGATHETDKGWSAEFFIPWSQMAMPKQDRVRRMGFYGSRDIGYLSEKWGWPALPDSVPQFMSLLQPVELEGVDPRQQWAVFPYASSTIDRVDDGTRYKAGIDLFWRPSSNFQLTATANPDFGSVESDDVVVNLTANEVFFPEKRLFFQEGREIFDTTPRAGGRNAGGGGDGNRFAIVNTRRIGSRPRDPDLPDGVELSERDELRPADLMGALKATGQLGAFRYGMLAAFEDETEYRADDDLAYFQDGRDFGAFRLLYEDSLGAAYRGLGFISTMVAHPESDAIVHAADVHYLTTNGRFKVDAQAIYSDVGDVGQGSGAFVDMTYAPSQGNSHELKLAWFDDTLEVNDLGFNQRNNLRDLQYRFEWIKSGLTRVRDIRVAPFVRYAENDLGEQVSGAYATRFEVTFNNLHFLQLFGAYFPERYDDRNSFGNGTFKVRERGRFSIDYTTNEANVFSLNTGIEYEGEAVEGRQMTYRIGLGWRPRSNINLQLQTSYLERDGWLLHQEDQNFTSFVAEQWQPRLDFDYFLTARQELRLGVQWVGIQAVEDRFYTLPTDTNDLVEGARPPGDSDSFGISQLNFQLRYRWQIAPLSDLYVVYTKADSGKNGLQGFRDLFDESWNNPLGDQLVIKLRYRLGS